jgi:type VI secretion system secreted protein VgrG
MPANQSYFQLEISDLNLCLSVDHFQISDNGISSDYQIKAVVRHTTPLRLTTLLKQKALLCVENAFSERQYWHGIVTEIEEFGLTPDGKEFVYQMMVHSPLYFLKLSKQSRVFLDSNVIDVLKKVLQTSCAQLNAQWQIRQNYVKRDGFIQRNCTDYDYLLRLVLFWGLRFSWLQSKDQVALIFFDNGEEFAKQLPLLHLAYQPLSGKVQDQSGIFSIEEKWNNVAGKVTIRDYNPNSLAADLSASVTTKSELANFGHEYRYGEHVVSLAEAEFIAKIRLQALDVKRHQIIFLSTCTKVQPGQTILAKQNNKSYRVIEVEHTGQQSTGKIYAENKNALDSGKPMDALTYWNKITCIPAETPYVGYYPIQNNYQANTLATIESAEENPGQPYLDDLGRYRVRFGFDKSDAPKGKASPPVRLAQPLSGEEFGIHWPLHAGTQVLIGFENGDSDRPVILGVVPHANNPSPVTAQNARQHILRTQSGHSLLLDDTPGASKTQLATPNLQHQLLLDNSSANPKIRLATEQGKMQIQTQKDFTTQTDSFYQQQIGGDHKVVIKNQYQVTTTHGDITLQSGRDLRLKAQNNMQITTQQGDIAFESGDDMKIKSHSMQILSQNGDLCIQSEDAITFLAEQALTLGAKGQGDMIFAQSGAQIKISADGSIHVQANQINFYSEQNNLMGQQANLDAAGQAAPKPPLQNPDLLQIKYRYADGTDSGIPIKTAEIEASSDDGSYCSFLPSDEAGKSKATYLTPGITLQADKLTAPYEDSTNQTQQQALAIIKINDQPHNPWQPIKIQVPSEPNSGDEPDKDHTVTLTAIRPPIFKDFTACVNNPKVAAPQLTEEELQYFKNNGNNAVVWIHGFNVELGEFPHEILQINADSGMPNEDDMNPGPPAFPNFIAQTDSIINTISRTFAELQQKFPQLIPDATINNDDPDIALNGSESHNWLLNMEYNLNCAASGQFPFDWPHHGKDYTRIIAIRWPGGNYGVEFNAVQDAAYQAGVKLVDLLLTLHNAGIKINLIAHSLGCRVALTTMQRLAQEKHERIIENAFLWEAAVPNDALNPTWPNFLSEENKFPSAYQAANKLHILYSNDDDVLKLSYLPDAEALRFGKLLRGLPALGSHGFDDVTQGIFKAENLLNTRIIPIPQDGVLMGHSYMKSPSAELFAAIYKGVIINKQQGIENFGKWDIN